MGLIARIATAVCGISMSVLGQNVWADARYNLQTPVTEIATEIYSLHNWMLLICLVIFVAVFGVMFYSVFAHRKSKGAVAAHFHESTTVEILWTIIPVLILVGMAYPATKTIIAMKDTSNPDITIKATGYQWKWGYDYIKGEGEGIALFSTLSTPRDEIENRERKHANYLLEVDKPLVVPIGKKIRVLTTANDVIHAWWVPAFGVKLDAIPGYIRDTWFKAEKLGVYRGNCAELCGKDHGFMPIVVNVVTAEEYTAWVDSQLHPKEEVVASIPATTVAPVAVSAVAAAPAVAVAEPAGDRTLAALKAEGETLYRSNCVACHQATGKGLPPAFPPLDGAAIVKGDAAAQIKVVLQGRPGTAMAGFAGRMTDSQIAALVTYTRNAWGNQSGKAVQATQVVAAR